MLSKLLVTLVTIVVGVAAAVVLYFLLNLLAEKGFGKFREKVRPYFFILPAIAVVAVYLVYPTLQTIFYSFANADSTKLVGIKNYTDLLGSANFHQTLLNTLIWIVVGPTATILLGLLVATLADRLRRRGEKLSKSIIFMPMAIGAVGSATIWRFVYAADPNIGLQNAVYHGILRFNPVAWLNVQNLHFNTLELIIIFLWGQIGFSMVLLSAAIKGVPVETLEAARIDGANEIQIFFRVIVPQIRVTIITVFITVLISTLKIFDIIYVTTNGNFNTDVIGLEFFNQQNVNLNQGYAATIVVILLVAVAPVMYFQVRQFRSQEAAR
jgi:alpha-glucoside transport system permease protein